jgi:predicted kinase
LQYFETLLIQRLALMITVLMGCPAAGKTTWMMKNKEGNEHIYSTEAVRTNREMDVDRFMHHIRTKAALAASKGNSVIADGTHTMDIHRGFWLNVAKKYDHQTRLIVFDTALHVALGFNSMRAYPAPPKIVRDHWRRCQMAMRKIDREGWDSIEIIKRGY